MKKKEYVLDEFLPKLKEDEWQAIYDFGKKYGKYLGDMPIQDCLSFALLDYVARLEMEEKVFDRSRFLVTKAYLINRMKIPTVPPEVRKLFSKNGQ